MNSSMFDGLKDETVWISDFILTSTKHNSTHWDLVSYLFGVNDSYGSIALYVVYGLSIIINSSLLYSIHRQPYRKRSMKVKLLVATLLTTLLVWSFLFTAILTYLQIFDPNSTIDAKHSEVRIEFTITKDWPLIEGLWTLLLHQMINNLLSVISLLLLTIAFDRYLNLFHNYSPFIDNIFVKICLVVFPFILTWTVLDYNTITFVLTPEIALFCRLFLLLCPSFLNFLFSLISCIRPLCAASTAVFESRMTSSLSRGLPLLVLFQSCLDIFSRTSLFVLLLETNFEFVIVTGSQSGDQVLSEVLEWSQWSSFWLIHTMPLYFPLLLLLFVRHYRILLSNWLGRIWSVLCCSRDDYVDYNTETMRTIMAQRQKYNHMMSSIH
ncbi:unnamed protein product [Auanema sp. JU1783]|nr:unnamed protein product [Auanema sp. JU1783]